MKGFQVRVGGLTCVLFIASLILTPRSLKTQENDWVERSNEHAQVLLQAFAELFPEAAGQWGVEGLDEKVVDLSPGFVERRIETVEAARSELKQRLAQETDETVKQDIEILINAADEFLIETRLNEKLLLPYLNAAQIIYNGLRNLLDDQVEGERRPAAVVRLKRYVGDAERYQPLTKLAREHTLREFEKNSDRIGPFTREVERDLENSERFVKEIGELFAKYDIENHKKPYELLKQQLSDYNEFLREEVLSRARTNFRLPRELYELQLKNYGVDMPVSELRNRAYVAFKELQNSLQALAGSIADERGFSSRNYKDVMAELKKDQIVGEEILPLYRKRIEELEEIVEREKIVTLPEREMRIRLATEAESAVVPAPFMRPPRFIGNTGEQGEFVLPLKFPGGGGDKDLKIDDFTHESASWPLAVHEGRPGHEMQFASVVEKGVSQARALFALNSVNVEGWALYMEEEMRPYLPLDGRFMTLWSRMVRVARAYLDPGLNFGDISREEATRVLSEEVGLSEALVLSEVDRYTFRAPGQATSYFCGYLRLMEIRTEVELLLGDKFDRQRYHDFLLAQGFLPPALLRKAVLNEFVPAREEAES